MKSLGDHFIEPAPGRLRALFPRRFRRAEVSAVRSVEPAPVMVQEFVAASRELRIYAVGGRLIAFELGVHPPDAPFTDSESLNVSPVPVPAELHSPLGDLTRRWGLDIAAFDLLDTRAGPVFLEVNVACDWLWLERRAGVRAVTDAVTELLENAFEGEPR